MKPTTMTMIAAATIGLAASPVRAQQPRPNGGSSDSPSAAVEVGATPTTTPNPPADGCSALDPGAPSSTTADPNGPWQDSGAAATASAPAPTDAWATLDGHATAGTGAPAAQLTAELGSSTLEAPDRSRRWLLSAGVGLQDCTGDLCDEDGLDTFPFLGQSFEVYGRLNDHVAIGVGFAALEMMPDSDDVTGNFFAGLAGLQGFLPLSPRLDLWGGLAAGYGGALFEEEYSNGYSHATTSTTFHGPVVAFSAGLDFWIRSWLTLGPSFTYYLTLWQEVCSTSAWRDDCADWDDIDHAVRDDSTLDYWMIAFRTTMNF